VTDTLGLLPILIPSLGGLWILMLVALRRDKALVLCAAHTLVLLGLSGAATVLLLLGRRRMEMFEGAILMDAQAAGFNLVFLTVAVLTVLSAVRHLQELSAGHGEFFALILFAVAGMTMMAASESLLTLFVGLEILSISLYVLAGFTRDRVYSVEGALKYFLLGAFSTGFLLYGIALLYGATGRIDLEGIARHLTSAAGETLDPLLLAGVVLLLVGLGFKVAAVPFHFWAPDVYQGSMAPVAGFMAAGTKAAGFAMLLRVLNVGLAEPPIRDRWIAVLGVLAILTMIVGNLVALAQRDIKRMLAYSSIANAGYLLVAVVAGGRNGRMAPIVLFYLAAYAFMTVGAFSVAALVGRAGEGDQGYALTAYAGLASRRPALAAAMAIFMLSLTGIPPTAGFMGKFYVFKSAVDAGMYGLAVTGVLASVVGACFYLRVVVQMYLRDPGPEPAPAPLSAPERLAIFAATAATIVFGFFPTVLLALTQRLT
jgi:NADH-quinone oxidoreductase subunit N